MFNLKTTNLPSHPESFSSVDMNIQKCETCCRSMRQLINLFIISKWFGPAVQKMFSLLQENILILETCSESLT